VSTTPVSDTFTVLKSFTGVNDTGNAYIAGVIDTGKDMHSPVSMTLAKHVLEAVGLQTHQSVPAGKIAVRM
jgi:hypothetical protein